MRPPHLSRRVMLVGGAAALTACNASGPPPQPPAQAPDSPETLLLKELVAEKERTIALYSSLIAGGAEKLTPFRDRHQAHLNELRKHLKAPASASATPSATASATPSATATPKTSLSRLRDLERKAAALRTRQLAAVSPGMAQVIASIGACEAAHAVALPRSL
ncbi:hypothetical protein ETD86_27940 [Nonomuraea turkmeniaca]|uniref:Uncharacterized protein n=1 Tax=Nonomuraea turkmeniaca TaxID=103838 RepID=A0A5S4FBB5_9ACTN|nr:hypothetical protein [Nonomuraea turkmeniaca]TMR15028.1 hypothetical protein ETD86_27940 [Nonomuraea turkmeniaca]